ncbi:helix-turn-helix transcriptional regulator [Saliterribacillus persicus]|uniref:Transcriptional regulator n=1 Tax=Saliterribacillus persicus TaxID=930114 RepID=A0A368YB68_9BACI|nr:helix-turn-helix transcriptional regulator [Saliterribacillus persicus]RCW77511.1 transcriptional regulator [Saliterribacillus persicus]
MNEHGEIRNQLPVLRAKKGYSQKDVAEKISVSRQTIASLEKNKYNPSLKLAYELALLFEVELDEVFQYKLKEDL